ncbi:MAG: tyrosine-type recombinase/integrase [Microcystaceae cyanobacterium]
MIESDKHLFFSSRLVIANIQSILSVYLQKWDAPDYVFVNCWSEPLGAPLKKDNVNRLFRQLALKTGIKAYPHLLRHTHATELIRAGWDMAYVQKRLGHADVQTTINTYAHLTDRDLAEEYQKYWQGRNTEER